MQWSDDEHAGFSRGTPWLPIAADYQIANVVMQRNQPTSILALYHRLIQLRRAEPALSVGEFAPLPASDDLMAYVRKWNERRLLIVLNSSARAQSFSIAELQCHGSLLLTTHLDRGREELADKLELRADEGAIIELR